MKSCFYNLLCTTKLAIKNLWEKFSFNKLMFRIDESVRERVCRRFVIYLSASHILKNSRPIERTHMVLLHDKRGTFLCFLGIGFLAEAEVFEHGRLLSLGFLVPQTVQQIPEEVRSIQSCKRTILWIRFLDSRTPGNWFHLK